jgi:hypothetical protein
MATGTKGGVPNAGTVSIPQRVIKPASGAGGDEAQGQIAMMCERIAASQERIADALVEQNRIIRRAVRVYLSTKGCTERELDNLGDELETEGSESGPA